MHALPKVKKRPTPTGFCIFREARAIVRKNSFEDMNVKVGAQFAVDITLRCALSCEGEARPHAHSCCGQTKRNHTPSCHVRPPTKAREASKLYGIVIDGSQLDCRRQTRRRSWEHRHWLHPPTSCCEGRVKITRKGDGSKPRNLTRLGQRVLVVPAFPCGL